MKSFADWKFCPTALIRVGVECGAHGQGYEYSCLLVVPWWQWIRHKFGFSAVGILEGMVSPEKMPANPAHLFAIARTVKLEGFKPDWDRFENGKPRERGKLN